MEALIDELRACTEAQHRFLNYGNRNETRKLQIQARWNRFASQWKAEMSTKTVKEKREIA